MKGLLTPGNAMVIEVKDDKAFAYSQRVDAMACGRTYVVVGNCDPPIEDPEDPDTVDAAIGYEVEPFTFIIKQKFGNRCGPDLAEVELRKAVAASTEYFVARTFWDGTVETDPADGWSGLSLQHDDIRHVAINSDPQVTLANVLNEAHDRHPELTPLVHLGWESALKLQSGLKNLDIDYAISPGYPPTGIAVTGPVVVRLGPVTMMTGPDRLVNRYFIEGLRSATVEFDPCLAVLAAAP